MISSLAAEASWRTGPGRDGERRSGRSDGAGPMPGAHSRVLAVVQTARFHGCELDVEQFRGKEGDAVPAAGSLSEWARNAGLWSKAIRLRWRNLMRLADSGPVVLLLRDGEAAVMTGADVRRNVVLIRDPRQPEGMPPVPVDELRLTQAWDGDAVLVRAERGGTSADAPFNLRWLADLVLQERRIMRDVGVASLTISILTVFPPLIVMAVMNRVLEFRSFSTLTLLAAMVVVITLYETLLGYARRHIVAVVGARLDAKLNLHIFNRLLRLPLGYYERHPAGETMYRTMQVHRVREFITGKLLTTILDLFTLCVLLPFLFYLNATLAWIVVGCAVAIVLIIAAFLRPMRAMYLEVTKAETLKSAALGESIFGIKTVKALALEPQRRAVWDERVADAGRRRLSFARLSNWPQTLAYPVERLMVLGTVMIGAYLAIVDPTGVMAGSLFAFMMLSQRVAAPLVGMAHLIEDLEEVGAAIGEVGSVINNSLENHDATGGLRPQLQGSISFEDVSFTYPGTALPALERVSFSVPAGTMLGIVGRSGSGKSTITRLLQGINRDFSGLLKIDGADIREINLRYLRQSFGVVLQDNFLFRGSIRDNIIAGRHGLTFTDAVSAARSAGAEEFIERLPNGYETYIEEGSPNLSGGQRQRLAIARALIEDPRILILDEATSALDPESEAIVNANLLRIARGRTLVIVSHRLSSLTECDQILVLERGQVVDIGPHHQLLQRCDLYRQLWSQQTKHMHKSAPHAAIAPALVKRD